MRWSINPIVEFVLAQYRLVFTNFSVAITETVKCVLLDVGCHRDATAIGDSVRQLVYAQNATELGS